MVELQTGSKELASSEAVGKSGKKGASITKLCICGQSHLITRSWVS